MNNSNLHVLNLAAYEAPEVVEDSKKEWVLYGDKNDYFSFLINNYKNSTTNNAVINNICKLVYGKGLDALDASRKPNEYAQAITLFDAEDLKKIILDYKMLGQAAIQIHYSKDHKKIIKIYHIPTQLVAPEKCNEDGNIEAYYYSDDWSDTNKYEPKRIPAFGYSKEPIEIMYLKHYTPSMKYFGCVDYQGGIPYCTLEEEISDYLINDVKNGMTSTKVVNFNNGIPTEEQQSIVSSKVMNKLTGANGQKVIVSFNADESSKTTIDDIQLDNAAEHYQYLADECLRKILVAHNVTSPLLFGIASKNGFSSNADELKDSYILFDNMVIKPIQNVILEALNKILAYNGIVLKLRFEDLQPLSAQGDLTKTDEAEDIINGINNLSPLVANKVLENMSPKEIRSLVGLKGDRVTEETDINVEMSTDKQVLQPDQQKHVLDNLAGEVVDEDEWELVDKRVCKDDNVSIEDWANRLIKPKKSNLTKLADFIKAYPNKKSSLDKDIYKVRYSYEQLRPNVSPSGKTKGKSRDFCRHMESRHSKGVRYRKEDIDMASFQGVNNKFGHKGQNYSLFRFKGGKNCYHVWVENLYRLKKKTDGDFYKDKSLASSDEVNSVPYIVNPKGWADAQVAPIDMPDQGKY